MPPRTVKKGAKRTLGRAAKGTAKHQIMQEETVETAMVEEVSVSVVEVEKETIKLEEPLDLKLEPNESVSVKEDVNEAFEEDNNGERLELEDNDPEYEAEEDAGVDYGEKEFDHDEDVREEGNESEEEAEEGDVGLEEAGDVVEEEMEDATEEVEGEEDGENGEEVHEDMADGEAKDHHDVVTERRKRKEFEVFVGGLEKDVTEDDLKKVFSKVGEVTEVRLMMNPLTKKNKGFAFLRFATVEQAKRAVTELKNPVINGKQCGVTPSHDSDTLFLGNICKSWTKEDLKEKLKHYGIDNVEDLTLVGDGNEERMNRGFAFLEFPSRPDAMDAFKRLQKRDVVFGTDRNAKVSFADSFIEPDDEIMAEVKTVFVDGLPASWDEDRVKEQLKKFGEIEKIDLARNMPSAKRRDFGFVTFDTHHAAVACANSINNAELGEGANKVKVRARLSRPHHRGRGKYASHSDFRHVQGTPHGVRGSWGRPAPPRFLGRSSTGIGGIMAQTRGRGFKMPLGVRNRHPVTPVPERVRPLPPPQRSYNRIPIPSYPKSSSKRDYGRRDELPSRSRAVADYGSRAGAERRSSYRDDYYSRGSGYSDDVPRNASHASGKRSYVDEGYGRRLERPPPSYHEEHPHNYDAISGSKRPYSALDDIPPRYTDASIRQSRARLDYDVGGSASQYGDAYSDRIGRSHLGYADSKSSFSAQDSQGMYGSRQSTGYGGGSYRGSDDGMYSSSFGSDYISRGPDVGGSSYSSLYSSRSLGGSSYVGSSGSRSYY